MKQGYKNALMASAAAALLLTGCGSKQEAPVSFAKQIKPIIDSQCIECHQQDGQGFQASGLSMESYDALIKGTKFGPVIKAGDALSSTLMILIDGRADPSINMPHGGRDPLSAEQIKLIEAWINQGAQNN